MDMIVEEKPVKRESGREAIARWKAIVADFQTPSAWRASWQLVNTLVPYALVWYLMYLSLPVSYWLTLPLAVLGGGLLVRIFIVFHDCGHGSFFRSKIANDVWGFLSGVLVFTPYLHWSWEHAVHHQTSGQLDSRGVGDVWTLTVKEYLEAPRWKKAAYRFVRNPLILFLIGPLILFLVRERFTTKGAGKRERLWLYATNVALALVAWGLIALMGWQSWLFIQLSLVCVAFPIGVWMFYVQHQYEDAYWVSGDDWDYTAAALEGSSFYKLPKVMQWFTGNIGFHHLHHLSHRIPNYHLERCHDSDPYFSAIEPMTLRKSLKSITYRLWDEEAQRMIGFGQLRRQLAEG